MLKSYWPQIVMPNGLQHQVPIHWPAFQYHARLKKLWIYTSRHPEQKLSLHRAAKIVRLNPNYFCLYFPKRVGVPFKYWTDYVRVSRAAALLRSSDVPILHVALDSGFDDPTTFTRTFRRILGMTPEDYRDAFRTARPDLKNRRQNLKDRRDSESYWV